MILGKQLRDFEQVTAVTAFLFLMWLGLVMASQHDIAAISAQLLHLEQELKSLELWGGVAGLPSSDKLDSTTPFCLDTLEFHQWLEYVLIARLRTLIAMESQLPTAMMIHTYAQEKYRGQWGKYRKLIGILQELDALITLEPK